MVGGDAVKVWRASRIGGLTLTAALSSVMLERVVTLLGLVLLVTLVEPFLFDRIGDNPAVYVFPLLTVGGIAGVVVLMLLDRLPERWRRWKIVNALAEVAADSRALFLRLRPAVLTLFLGILGPVNLSMAMWFLLRGLGAETSLLDCVTLVPPVILLMTLPISISGWGVREGAMVTAFGFIGVSPEATLVASFIFGLMTMAVAVPGGAVWLASGRDKPEAEQAAAPSDQRA